MTLFRRIMPSPVGNLHLVGSDAGLAAIVWDNDRPGRVNLGPVEDSDRHPVLKTVERQLREYFAGKRTRFDLKLDFHGTDFHKAVWRKLLAIPFGETRTYRDIAVSLGRPTATRAVGAANGRNPIAIIAPCHRLIGVDGSLRGFAGGLKAKQYLLDLEAAKPRGGLRRRER